MRGDQNTLFRDCLHCGIMSKLRGWQRDWGDADEGCWGFFGAETQQSQVLWVSMLLLSAKDSQTGQKRRVQPRLQSTQVLQR